MAVLNMGVIVTDIRGKLAGNQFSKSRAGNILQRKCNQKKGGTPSQSNRRAVFADFAKYWRSLTDSERAQNNANTSSYPVLDRFGNVKFLSGFQLLLRSNINLRTLGSSPIQVVPATPPAAAGVTVVYMNIAVIPSGVTEAVFETTDLTGDYSNKTFVLYISPGVSPGISNYNGRFTQIGTYVPDVTTYSFAFGYPNTLVLPTAGDKVFMILDMVDNATGVVVNSYRYNTIVNLGLSLTNVTLTSGVAWNFYVTFFDGSYVVPSGYKLRLLYSIGTRPAPNNPNSQSYTVIPDVVAGTNTNPYIAATDTTNTGNNYIWWRADLVRLSDSVTVASSYYLVLY